jgi:hypothetical protein
MARVKFKAGERVQANEKAPAEYRGRVGRVLLHRALTSEYQVQFDGDDRRGCGWFFSFYLDSAPT